MENTKATKNCNFVLKVIIYVADNQMKFRRTLTQLKNLKTPHKK